MGAFSPNRNINIAVDMRRKKQKIMPDSPATDPQLHKRQRNLIFFSMAILILGWAPDTMPSSFTFLGLGFKNIDQEYMWSWATGISAYLYLAWIYTARAEDQWLFFNGSKIRELFSLRDFFWLHYITWRKAMPHGFSAAIFGGDNNNPPITLNVKTYPRMILDSDIYHAISHGDGQVVDADFCKTHLTKPNSNRGYLLNLHIGEYKGKQIHLVRKHHTNGPHQTVRELKTQLYYSVMPPIILGAIAILTSANKLYASF